MHEQRANSFLDKPRQVCPHYFFFIRLTFSPLQLLKPSSLKQNGKIDSFQAKAEAPHRIPQHYWHSKFFLLVKHAKESFSIFLMTTSFHLQVAYNKYMSQIQEKLQTCIENQSTSMEGLARLSKQLGNSDLPEPQSFDDVNERNTMMVEDGKEGVADALETTTARVAGEKDVRGENKAPRKKSGKGRKYSHMLRAKGVCKREQREKPKPKFFCQF